MDKYRLILKDKNIFSQIINDFHDAEKFKNCSLLDVIVIPSLNRWEIKLKSPNAIDTAEISNFLSRKFYVTVKIFLTVDRPVENKISLQTENLSEIFFLQENIFSYRKFLQSR